MYKVCVQVRNSCLSSFKVQLVEGASGDWIPKMKEHFGIKTFDLVFLDHWKDRYLPDTKLMEASCVFFFFFFVGIKQTHNFSALTLTLLLLSGVWSAQEGHRPAGRQCHLPWDS